MTLKYIQNSSLKTYLTISNTVYAEGHNSNVVGGGNGKSGAKFTI